MTAARMALAAAIAGLAAIEVATLAQTPGATIAGQVMSTGAQPQPVRRAIVTVSGGTIAGNLSVVSDDQGRFRFVDLGAGRYTLSAQKAGYLKMAYGATRPGRPGVSVALAAGQKLDLRVPLPRGAVITGTVRDEFGQPASGVQVTISQSSLLTAEAGFRSSADSVLTDDRGVYRVFGLMPDEYVVSALPRATGAAETSRLSRAEFDARIRALEQRLAGEPDAGRSEPEPERVAFAPIFFPGTPVAAGAGRIRLEAGEERAGVDIPLTAVRAARVSGVIQSGDIEPQRIRPALTLMGPPQPGLFQPQLIGPSSDGSFSFINVTPGRYTLIARTGPGAMMTSMDGRGGSSLNPGVAALFAMMEFDVDGRDIGGQTLALRPAMTMSGRIVFDAATAKPPASPTSVRVTLTTPRQPSPTILNGVGLGSGPPPGANARADATFEIVGIIPGTYGVTAASTGWWLRSVIFNGRDLLDEPIDVTAGSGNMDGAIVTFTDKRSELSGTLTTASGQPASEFTVLVFPSDRALWRPGARRIKTARPATDGAFTFAEMPAGEYFLAALTDFGPDDLNTPSFLEQIVAAAAKVTIPEGGKVRQDLRIAR